jgi:hypothetical protein|tara:strand:+ start:3594 stop:4463 length:870 start_codon:yes stop_codon:yes gene_type:complete
MPTAEMTVIEKPKAAGFVDSKYTNANARRIAEAEVELEELTSNDAEEVKKEATVEAKEKEPDTGEERTYKKRYDDIRKLQSNTAAELKAIKAQLENAKDQGVVRPPKSDEDIQAWADKYPDVAAIVETIAEKKAQEKFSYAEDRLKQIDEMSAEADRNKSLDSIRSSHVDFDDLKESDEFHDWAGEQPKWVQDALYENQDDPRSVVRVIDLYKSDKGMDTKSRKRATKDAAKAVVNKRATKPDTVDMEGSFSESQVKKMSDKEFEKNMDAIMESQRTGKFTYDLSGGAR